MPNTLTLVLHLQALRESLLDEKCRTQRGMASYLGISERQYQNLENKVDFIYSVQKISRLCEMLQCDVRELIELTNEKEKLTLAREEIHQRFQNSLSNPKSYPYYHLPNMLNNFNKKNRNRVVQIQVCEFIGISLNTLRNWGKIPPSHLIKIIKLCILFDCRVEDLFDDDRSLEVESFTKLIADEI
jgi:DNA-binding Xre family transcriptional regulator